MRRKRLEVVLIGLSVLCWSGKVEADVLDIEEVQSNVDADWNSVYDGERHDVISGIVTHVIPVGFSAGLVYLQQPGLTAWGGMLVKDFSTGRALANGVAVGDQVNLTNVEVDEYRNFTKLLYDDASLSTTPSTGNPVPAAISLTAADLKVNPTDHSVSEQYESMLVTLAGPFTVGGVFEGSKQDCYELMQGGNIAYGTGYLHTDFDLYDPPVFPGRELDSVTGIVEQYVKSPSYDYYQIDTRASSDVVPEPGMLCLLAAGVMLVRGRRRASADR